MEKTKIMKNIYYRGAPNQDIFRGDFPGVWLSKQKRIAEQYGKIWKYSVDGARLLDVSDKDARLIEVDFLSRYPHLEEFYNQDGEWLELWIFPPEELIPLLNARGYDGYINGSDTFIWNRKKVKSL